MGGETALLSSFGVLLPIKGREAPSRQAEVTGAAGSDLSRGHAEMGQEGRREERV